MRNNFKFKNFFFLLILIVFLPIHFVFAQTEEGGATTPPAPEPELRASAGEDRNVVIGRTVLFDASGSVVPVNANLEYLWDFGDGAAAKGIDATHIYNSSGTYRVHLTVQLFDDNKNIIKSSENENIVSVQDNLLVLITDSSVDQKKIESLQRYGLTKGTLVIPLKVTSVDQEYLTIQNLDQQILKNIEDVAASNTIVTWTSGGVGLNAFIELTRVAGLNNASLENFRFNKKALVDINNQSLTSAARLAQTTFQNIQPQYIVVADEKILDDVVAYPNPEELKTILPSTDARYQLITEYSARGLKKLSPLNFLSFIMNYMINKGVPINALFLTLMIPVMATIVAFARQIIGVKALGIFIPTILSLSLLSTGMKYGVVVFVIVLIVGTCARILARRLRILYLPRMALVLSVLTLSIFVMLLVAALLDKKGFMSVSIFPVLIMAVLTEHFIAVQIEQGYKTAIKLTLETFILAAAGYYIGNWVLFRTTLLAYPELIFITFLINFILGKFSGLRLSEYIRFRKVFKRLEHVETTK